MRFPTLGEDISFLVPEEEIIAAVQENIEENHFHTDGSPVRLNLVKRESENYQEYSGQISIAFGCTCHMIFTESGGRFISESHGEDYGAVYEINKPQY